MCADGPTTSFVIIRAYPRHPRLFSFLPGSIRGVPQQFYGYRTCSDQSPDKRRTGSSGKRMVRRRNSDSETWSSSNPLRLHVDDPNKVTHVSSRPGWCGRVVLRQTGRLTVPQPKRQLLVFNWESRAPMVSAVPRGVKRRSARVSAHRLKGILFRTIDTGDSNPTRSAFFSRPRYGNVDAALASLTAKIS
jgi:hypothetical protein